MRFLFLFKFTAEGLGIVFLLSGCATSLENRKEVSSFSPPDLTNIITITPGFRQREARVRSMRGSGYVWKQKWETLEAGQKLTAGSIIRTGRDGTTDLFLSENGSNLRIRANSVLLIERLEYQGEIAGQVCHTRFRLKEGSLDDFIRGKMEPSSYEVESELVSIKGIPGRQAAYTFSADGHCKVSSGALMVTDNGTNLVLKAGDVWRASTQPPPRSCEVHHLPMTWMEEPIGFGYRAFPPGYLQDRVSTFPHDGEIDGGCVITLIKEDFTWVCPQCVIAHKNWKPRFREDMLSPEQRFLRMRDLYR